MSVSRRELFKIGVGAIGLAIDSNLPRLALAKQHEPIKAIPEKLQVPEVELTTFFDIHIDPQITADRQEFFRSTLLSFAELMAQLPTDILSLATQEKIPVVIFTDLDYQRQFSTPGSNSYMLFTSFPEQPNSGTDNTLWVNESSPQWQEYSLLDQQILMGGEIFRVIQSRLGVDMNNPELNSFEIPDWYLFGSPLAWATSALPEGNVAVQRSAQDFEEAQIDASDLHAPHSIADMYYQENGPQAYWSTLYLCNELITLHGEEDYSRLLSNYQLLGQGVTAEAAFEQTFGVNSAQFEAEYETREPIMEGELVLACLGTPADLSDVVIYGINSISLSPEQIESLWTLRGRGTWTRSGNYGFFDVPADVRELAWYTTIITGSRDGVPFGIQFTPSFEKPEFVYITVYNNTVPFADAEGDHYGIHPCNSFEVDKESVNALLLHIGGELTWP